MSAINTTIGNIAASSALQELDYASPRLRIVIHLGGGNSLVDDLDERWLRLEQVQGQSQPSQVFSYQLELRANDILATNKNTVASREVSPKDVLGKPATVQLLLPGENSGYTYLNGIITSFSLHDSGSYRAELKPALWHLSLSNDYRIFANMTIKEVLQAVIRDKHTIACDFDGVGGLATARRQDWLQSGESDLQFISGLMQKVGIFFYFVHAYASHTAVFANTVHYVPACAADSSTSSAVSLYYTYAKAGEIDQDYVLSDFSYKQELSSSKVSSRTSEPGAAWHDNATATLVNFDGGELENAEQALTSSDVFFQYQVFPYGTSTSEAEDYAKLSLSQLQSSASELSATTACPLLRPGHLFITRQYVDSRGQSSAVLTMRPEFDNKLWVVKSTNEQYTSEGKFVCQFSAVAAMCQLTPFNIAQTHQGSVLAIVTNAPTDKSSSMPYLHYLEKNNFSYDTNVFNSSYTGNYFGKGVYVKFATDGANAQAVWVKLAKHMQTIPEVGVVVMVAKSQDNGEIPEIQSIVQSKGNKTVIPDDAIDSTNVGDNYSTSYGDSHSIRFGRYSNADLAKARKIVTDAYDEKKYKDVSYSQGAGFSYSSSEDLGSGLLSHSISYGCTYSYFEGDSTQSESKIGSSVNRSVITDLSESTSVVEKSRNYSVIGSQDEPEKAAAYDSYASVNTHKNVGSSYSKSTITGDAINDSTIEGEAKNISSIGKSHSETTITKGSYNKSTLSGGAYNWSMTDSAEQINITGEAVNVSVTGLANTTSVTGEQASESVVGAQVNVSAVGENVSAGVIGLNASVQVNLVSSSANINLSGADFEKEASIKAKASEIDAKIGTLSAEITDLKATL